METSENLDELAKALAKFHGEVGKVRKSAKNPFFSSRYATLSTILETIADPLTTNGLSIIQTPHGEYQLTTMLIHESGQWLRDTYTMTPSRAVVVKGEPTEITPQTVGSAITYQRRYAIGAILSLNIDEDDDGNSASRPATVAPPKSDVKF